MTAPRRFYWLAVAPILVAAPLAAGAAEKVVDLDPARTRISFTLKATLHTVEGTAKMDSGSLVFDTDTGAVRGEVVIDSATVETGNSSRDKKMHGKVLLSGSHPRIVLRPSRLGGPVTTGDNTGITVVGEIELLGAPHPISIPMNIRIDGGHLEATAEFTVPYVEWGLLDPSTLVLRVAKEVRVHVVTTGTISSPPL